MKCLQLLLVPSAPSCPTDSTAYSFEPAGVQKPLVRVRVYIIHNQCSVREYWRMHFSLSNPSSYG